MNGNDEQELTADQLEKVVQFQEVTGVEDISIAKVSLSEHDWSVEAAVQDHLSIQDSPNRTPSTLRGRSRSLTDSPFNRDVFEIDRRSAVSRGGTSWLSLPQRAIWGIFRWCYYVVSLPFKVMISVIYRLIIPNSGPIDPIGDVVNFITDFEATYGPSHPSFFRGSYNQALSTAKSDLKFLIVYLHCKDHQHTDAFCSTVLCDSKFINYFKENVILWGCSVRSSEGYRVSQALRENGYPFLAVIVLKDNRMTVVARFEGLKRPDILINNLRDVITDNGAYLVVARADRQEREVNAALRLEQDEAYLESLRVDQEKERKKREERDQERSILEEKEKIRRLKIEWADRVPQEPEECESGIIHIVAKLPQGTRLNRRFYNSESLSGLYYYVFCHPDSPDRFQVTTNFPRRIVPCEPMSTGEPISTTFSDFGLPQRSMLFVTDLDA